jgi:hypothetical protein
MGSNRYRIIVRGRLSERFGPAFEGMALGYDSNQTVLIGDVRDQAQLHGYWGEQRSAITATARRPLLPDAADQALYSPVSAFRARLIGRLRG